MTVQVIRCLFASFKIEKEIRHEIVPISTTSEPREFPQVVCQINLSVSLSNKYIVLYLPVLHDETRIWITICNDNYKFIVFSHSILQEYVVVNEMMVMVCAERFLPRTMRKLHA